MAFHFSGPKCVVTFSPAHGDSDRGVGQSSQVAAETWGAGQGAPGTSRPWSLLSLLQDRPNTELGSTESPPPTVLGLQDSAVPRAVPGLGAKALNSVLLANASSGTKFAFRNVQSNRTEECHVS